MRLFFMESSDRQSGRISYSEILSAVGKNAKKGDFLILPEVFDTGWNVNSETEFSSMGNVTFFHQLSEKYGISVCGSFYVKKDGYFYNRFAAVTKDGEEFFTEKRHPFGEFETENLKPGNEILTFQINSVKFRGIICYDLRFPVWCRQNDKENPYDVLLCVSQWPLQRAFDKDLLTASRALENVSYAVNCNALGGSKVFFADGKEVFSIQENEKIAFYELDKEKLIQYRQHKKYLSDADKFKIM